MLESGTEVREALHPCSLVVPKNGWERRRGAGKLARPFHHHRKPEFLDILSRNSKARRSRYFGAKRESWNNGTTTLQQPRADFVTSYRSAFSTS
jgi:hypothetical protein